MNAGKTPLSISLHGIKLRAVLVIAESGAQLVSIHEKRFLKFLWHCHFKGDSIYQSLRVPQLLLNILAFFKALQSQFSLNS